MGAATAQQQQQLWTVTELLETLVLYGLHHCQGKCAPPQLAAVENWRISRVIVLYGLHHWQRNNLRGLFVICEDDAFTL